MLCNSCVSSIFTAQRYAGMVYAVAICLFIRPFVCLSQVGIVSKRLNRAGFCYGGFLRPVPHCVMRKFGYLQNKGTSLWNLSQTPDLENFATASQQRCQQKSSSSSMIEFVDTYTTVDESWLFTTELTVTQAKPTDTHTHTHTHTHNRLTAFCPGLPEETFTHSHPS